MSTTATEKPWLELPTRRISPLRTYQTVPAMSRSVRDPQADGLDGAGGLAEVDDVADAVLVLEHHEDAGQEVAHEVLGAETDGDAEDAGRRDDRGEVHPELAEDQHERDAVDQRTSTNDRSTEPIACARCVRRSTMSGRGVAQAAGRPVAQRAQQRRDPPLAGAAGQPVDRAVHREAQDHRDDDDQEDDDGVREQLVGGPGQPVGLREPVDARTQRTLVRRARGRLGRDRARERVVQEVRRRGAGLLGAGGGVGGGRSRSPTLEHAPPCPTKPRPSPVAARERSEHACDRACCVVV